MSQTRWLESAPSNIALIKYMGKTDSSANRPTNTSLSYTLDHLKSWVELEPTSASHDTWQPLSEAGGQRLVPLALTEKGTARFLAHMQRLKTRFDYSGSFVVRSGNDFPSDCGLASSASSFAALTRATLKALSEITGSPQPTIEEAAELSRMGSGSSCRSFFSPWSIWRDGGASAASEITYRKLIHQVVVVEDAVKTVSSSAAHERVTTSLLFEGRPERAENRASDLITALTQKDWARAFEITWAEFWDMHALFETSQPSFGYMTSASLDALRIAREYTWDAYGDGPLITMDAGPNIHLLYRDDKLSWALAGDLRGRIGRRYKVLTQ